MQHRYEVYRSGQSFDITAEIIRDLCRADIVIADLSGSDPNPNVMYELGVRLAVAARPVILIREQRADNHRIFDIGGFYTHHYDPYDYQRLELEIVDKLRRWEAGDEPYTNPVLALIKAEMAKTTPDLLDVSPEVQRELAMRGIRAVAMAVRNAFGPEGVGLGVQTKSGGVRLERSGVEIARGMQSANPFEEAGILVMASAATQTVEKVGDGSKLAVILAHEMIEGALVATSGGIARSEVLHGMEGASSKVVKRLLAKSIRKAGAGALAAKAASHREIDVDVWGAVEAAGAEGIVRVEEAQGIDSVIEVQRAMVVDRGAAHPDFLRACAGNRCILEDCAILLYTKRISALNELLPVLEGVARLRRPLLVMADDVTGEALAMMLVNQAKGTLRSVAVRAPAHGDRRLERMQDLAALTGATLIDPEAGGDLHTVDASHLGRAERVIVDSSVTEIIGGQGDPEGLRRYVENLRAAGMPRSPYDADQRAERVARLVGSVVTIHLGAATAEERHLKRYRVVSAMRSSEAAIRGGVALGAGRALVLEAEQLDTQEDHSEGQRAGCAVVRRALLAPQHAIMATTKTDLKSVADQLSAHSGNLGFNATSARVEDLEVASVMDATEVLVEAVRVADLTARTFLETGSWLVKAEKSSASIVDM